jgi:hypothetical protein
LFITLTVAVSLRVSRRARAQSDFTEFIAHPMSKFGAEQAAAFTHF